MGNKLTNAITENLRRPTKSFTGRLVVKGVFKRKNRFLSENAATLSNIEPHHEVLELGFGPGIGLETALEFVKGGNGKVSGVDFSPYMVSSTSKRLASHITSGKLKLIESDVANMPFNNDLFHRVFHCNCYYFWEDMDRCCAEVYRVMAPHSLMVTTLDLKSLKETQEKGMLTKYRVDPIEYMAHLEGAGFTKVQIKYLNDSSGKEFQAIFAHIEGKEDLYEQESNVTDDKSTDQVS